MPQQSHHKGSEREQGKGETGPRVTAAEREGKAREGKQSGAGERGRSNDDGRAKKRTNKTPMHRTRKH